MELPRAFKENSCFSMKPVFLTALVYAEAISSFIVVCTDAVIIDRERRTIFLAQRIVEPAKRLWWIFGGRWRAGEEPRKSMTRCFLSETTLEVDKSRFDFLTVIEEMWCRREQAPQDTGTHALAYVFTVELTLLERCAVSDGLNSEEYDKRLGLLEFSKEGLPRNPTLRYLYDLIFPSKAIAR